MSEEQISMAKRRSGWKWCDDFPTHLRTLADSLHELDILQKSHINALTEHNLEAEYVDDLPQIFHYSAVVYLTAVWEAFVEDLASAAATRLIEQVVEPSLLPKSIKKIVANGLKNDKSEIAAWNLGGNSWKDYALEQLKQRIDALNTPKSSNIDALYVELFGVKILECWTWEAFVEGHASVTFDIPNTIFYRRFCFITWGDCPWKGTNHRTTSQLPFSKCFASNAEG